MTRKSIVRALLPLFFDSLALCQTAPASNEAPFRVYAVLKPSVMQQSASHDALLRRMGALGAANLQYYAGVNAIRCDVPLLALAALRNDPDVVGVLPVDSARDPVSLTIPSSLAPTDTPVAAPPHAAAVQPAAVTGSINAPPVTATACVQPTTLGTAVPPQLTFPQQVAGGSGALTPAAPVLQTIPAIPQPAGAVGGINAPPMIGVGGVQPTFPSSGQPPMLGTGFPSQLSFPQPVASTPALLAEMAAGLIGRLLTRQPSCQMDTGAAPAAVPNAGGTGSFVVRASGTCAWQAISTADWVEITSGTGGIGTTVVVYKVAAGSVTSRTGNIYIQAAPGSSPLKGRTVQTVSQQ